MKQFKLLLIKLAIFFAILLTLSIFIDQSWATPAPNSIYCSVRSSSKANAFKKGKVSCEIVDHVCALANGGRDIKSNMQCQTTYTSRTKDLIENTPEGRDLYCNEKNSLPYRTVFNSRERLIKVTYCKKK